MFTELWKILFPKHRPSQNKTVRYAFPIVIFTALLAGLASVITDTSSYISIQTSPTSVKEGEPFYIDISATANTPVNAVDVILTYPETQMSVESIDTGTSVITLWAKNPYAEGGHVYLQGGVFGKGFLGKHTIARIRAKGLVTGLAHVTTEKATFVAGDGLGTPVDVSNIGSDETRIYITSLDGSLVGTADFSIFTDIDGDGKVDLKDISVFMAAWFTKGKLFDFNNDGRMTFSDFSILLSDSFFK